MYKIFCLYLATFSFLFSSDLPEPYSLIKVLPYDDHGWFGNAVPLDKLIKQFQPKTVIEVGSWLGKSTRFLAERVDKVYAVDTWLGSEEAPHLRDPRLDYLYQLFLSNVIHKELTQKIVPVRMKSIEAANALNLKADLIYIDASHDFESVLADIYNWQDHLNEGGLFCGDDWTWKSVAKAVKVAALSLGKKVHVEGNFWWFE